MILDTNGLSAVADGDLAVVPALRTADMVAIPVVVLGEYLYGIRKSRERLRYEQWLTQWIPTYQVLDVDQATAEQYAEIRDQLKVRGRPIPSNDIWIAALALQHALPVLSRDRHFDFVPGLKRIGF